MSVGFEIAALIAFARARAAEGGDKVPLGCNDICCPALPFVSVGAAIGRPCAEYSGTFSVALRLTISIQNCRNFASALYTDRILWYP